MQHLPAVTVNHSSARGTLGLASCCTSCERGGPCTGGGLGDLSSYFPDLDPSHLRYLAWGLGAVLIWAALKR